MALVAVAGPGLIGLAFAFSQWWLLVPGSLAAGLAPAALFAMLTRGSRPVKNGYRDQNFIGGMLTVFGFSPTVQEAAAREAKLKKERTAD
jgi:hypothetical protein